MFFDGKLKEFGEKLITELTATSDLMEANANSSMVGLATESRERLYTVALTLRTLGRILAKVIQ